MEESRSIALMPVISVDPELVHVQAIPEDFGRESGKQGPFIVPNRQRKLPFLHWAGVLFVETYQTSHEIC
jgi:hypothetical protein